MARRDLTRTQRFLTAMVDAPTAAAMEAHSRAWLITCRNCGFARSVWDMGGIRYKAAGRDSERGRCPRCGKVGWHDMVKAADFPTTNVPSGSLIRMIVLVALIPLAFTAAILLLVFWLTGMI